MDNETLDTGSTGTETTVDAGTPTGNTGVDTSTSTSAETNTSQPDEFSTLESMFADVGKDETTADEPAAASTETTTAIPEEFAKLIGGDYIKEPAHLEAAVNAANEVWDVVNGKTSASGLLEGMRQANPTGYERMIREDIIPYIEHITGQKLGGAAAETVDPVAAKLAALEAKQAEIEARPIREAQQRAQQEQINQATQSTFTKLSELSKGTFFEGKDPSTLAPALLNQFAAMKTTPEAVMKEVLKGNTASLEKAFRAINNEKVKEIKAYSDWYVKTQRAKRAALPAGTGNPAGGGKQAAAANDMSGWSLQQMADAFNKTFEK
jgi:hypothetical protein